MRLFLALDLSDPLRQSMAEAINRLRPMAPRARWVGAASLHLTLHFLGETGPDRLPALRARLAQVQAAAVPLHLRGWGFFPDARPPRVFWVGVEPAPALLALQAQLQARLVELGWAAPGEAYTPHLTLARARQGRELQALQPLLSAPAPDWGEILVREYVLYQSRPRPGEHQYTPLARFALRHA